MTARISDRSRLYLDSGATDHVTGDRNLMQNVREGNFDGLSVANGQELVVRAMGDIALTRGCIVRNVLYSPQASVTLLSASRLARYGWSILLSERESYLRNGNTRIAVSEQDGLYALEAVPQAKAELNSANGDPLFGTDNPGGTVPAITPEQQHLLHRRFGHIGNQRIAQLENATENLRLERDNQCSTCVQGKSSRKPARKKYQGDEDQRNQTVYVDILGPFPEGHGHVRNYLVCLHHSSKFLDVYMPTEKTVVLDAMTDYCNRYTDFKVVQADMDGVFRSAEWRRLLRTREKLVKCTTPYRHEFHPVERFNRTLMDKARAMLVGAKLSENHFLPFAVETAAVLHNYTPRDGKTPFELRFGSKPDVGCVRVFGCKVLIHNPNPYPKQNPRAREGILLSFGMPSFHHSPLERINCGIWRLVK